MPRGRPPGSKNKTKHIHYLEGLYPLATAALLTATDPDVLITEVNLKMKTKDAIYQYLDGESTAQIARERELSQNTVIAQIRRGLSKIEKHLRTTEAE